MFCKILKAYEATILGKDFDEVEVSREPLQDGEHTITVEDVSVRIKVELDKLTIFLANDEKDYSGIVVHNSEDDDDYDLEFFKELIPSIFSITLIGVVGQFSLKFPEDDDGLTLVVQYENIDGQPPTLLQLIKKFN